MLLKKRNITFLLFILTIFFVIALQYPARSYYPALSLLTNESEQKNKISFIFDKQSNLKNCFQLLGRTAQSSLNSCPTCQITEIQCTNDLDKLSQLYLAEIPLNYYSVRMTDGVAIFESEQPNFSSAACAVAEKNSTLQNAIKCYPPNTKRSLKEYNFWQNYNFLLLLVLCLLVSYTVCWLINRYEHLHAHLSHDHADSGPQKLHSDPIPRIGGIAIMIGLLFAALFLLYQPLFNVEYQFAMLILAGAPAFFGGLIEDFTKRVGVLERLLLTMFSGLLAVWLIGLILPTLPLGWNFAERLLLYTPVTIIFTCFAVGGVANAINLIDGVNGLASATVIIATIAVTYVAGQVADGFVYIAGLTIIGSTLGFFLWNWPRAKLFLGDGGAYILGFFVAEMAVALVLRNQQVSPWLLILLLIHPIYETLFSMFRRLVINKKTIGAPDAEHLHQLIYAALRDKFPNSAQNYQVAPIICLVSAIFAGLGCLDFSQSKWQVSLILSYCLIYTISYYLLRCFLATKLEKSLKQF